jgi:chromosome partitioning protein
VKKLTIIAVANQKGGVGKTTITYNLAAILSNRRHTKVLAIDNDPQGNLTASYIEDSIPPESTIIQAYNNRALVPLPVTKNLHLIGADIGLSIVTEQDFQVIFRLKESLEKMQKKSKTGPYDLVIIDCLPSFGHLQVAALHAADFVLIPIKPAPYALAGLKELFATIEKVKRYFNRQLRVMGIVINQFDGRRLLLEREMEAALRESYGDLVFRQRISKRIKIEESPAFQKPIVTYNRREPAVKEFNALASEIIRRIKRLRTDAMSKKNPKYEK